MIGAGSRAGKFAFPDNATGFYERCRPSFRSTRKFWASQIGTDLAVGLFGHQQQGAVLSEERSCSPMTCSLSGCYAPRYEAALMLRHDGFSARRCGSRDRLAVFSGDTVGRDQSPYGPSESQHPVRPQMADAHLAVDLKVERVRSLTVSRASNRTGFPREKATTRPFTASIYATSVAASCAADCEMPVAPPSAKVATTIAAAMVPAPRKALFRCGRRVLDNFCRMLISSNSANRVGGL